VGVIDSIQDLQLAKVTSNCEAIG